MTDSKIPAQDARRVFASMLDQILEDSPGVYVGAGSAVAQSYGTYQEQDSRGQWTVPYPGCTLHRIKDPYYYQRIIRFLESDPSRRWIRTHCTGPYDGVNFTLTEAGVSAAVTHFGKSKWDN